MEAAMTGARRRQRSRSERGLRVRRGGHGRPLRDSRVPRSSLLHVSAHDVDQLLGGSCPLRLGPLLGVEDVVPDVILDHLAYETVQSPSCGGDRLQDFVATLLLGEGPLDPFDLSPYPADSRDELLPVSNGMHAAEPRDGCIPPYSICPSVPREGRASDTWTSSPTMPRVRRRVCGGPAGAPGGSR